MRPYLKLTGTATIEEGGAPELLSKLAKVVGNPDATFPPADAPPGFITRIHINKVGGTGPGRIDHLHRTRVCWNTGLNSSELARRSLSAPQLERDLNMAETDWLLEAKTAYERGNATAAAAAALIDIANALRIQNDCD